ncbi:hypothetical protein [Cellulophaga sp. Hel_I_12]|uniref:hypothetical protein n=1 Tax=Cellulophaga sp. Hel_I_12 TaxID=1249972 RepID=UPI000645B131|nr:hypothetical protein [Cellulophaga sp. Hel_I_12]
MKKLIAIIVLPLLFINCQNNERTAKLETEIEGLKRRNDSLVNIVNGIKEKYVFDNVAVRTIPSYKNTDKLNSISRNEIVFIAYNDEGKSRVMFNESQEKGAKYKDTLQMENGAFILERKLTEEKNFFSGFVETQNDYGKVFGTNISIGVLAQ